MPLDFPSAFSAELLKQAQPDPFLWLVQVMDPDEGPLVGPAGSGDPRILRLTANSTPVTFDFDADSGLPIEWTPWAIKFGDIRTDSQGNINGISLEASAGIGSLWRLWNDNSRLRGHRLDLILVHSLHLGDPSAKFVIRTTIEDSSADWTTLQANLSLFNGTTFTVPQASLGPTCRHGYRRPGCDFVGDPGDAILGPCALTLEACTLRGDFEVAQGLTVLHPRRFGGQKGLPRGNVRR